MTKARHSQKAPTPGALPPGAKLGKYEIVEQLGSGGQAIVYRGYDGLLDRYVAIKQVAPQLAADDSFIQRFRQVTRQLAKLNCEQIVTIHDLIEDRAGLFMVMEFVEGHTIERTLRENPGPVEPKAALQIIWRIAAGLAAIHKAGIVHRDIKPGNIIVGEGLRVKITDFGVAAPTGAAASMRLGTTKYMAPELFAGAAADERVDIYSLGMIAYEMLLGRKKFNEVFADVVRDPHSESLRWMKWHSSPEQLAPLAGEVNPEVPPALSAIVERMLAKSPEDRFASVEELGREIRVNFSPRGPRPAGETARTPRLSLEGAARVERRGSSAVQQADDLTLPAVAEELPAEPATAEVPKLPMSRRKKLTLVGVAAGVAMAGLITVLLWSKIEQRRLDREADRLYDDAELVYKTAAQASSGAEKTRLFQAALEGFRGVIKGYDRKARVVADQARVMGFLARAQLDVLAGDARATGRALKSALDLNDQILRTSSGPAYDWARRKETQLDEFRSYWLQQRDYADTIAKVLAARDAGGLDEALALLNEKARRLAVTDEQEKQVEGLRAEIRVLQKKREHLVHVHAAEDLASKGNVPGALASYDQALEVLEAAKTILPAETYEQLKKATEADKATLQTDTAYAKVIAQARKAERAKSLLAAADAYENAHKLKPDQKLLEKVRDLRHDHHLDAGQKHLAAGRAKEAEDDLKKAQSYKPSAAVEAALKKLQTEKDYRQLVWQGDRLYRQRNYEGALEKYESAGRIRTDGELKGKISDCTFAIALAKAEGYRAEQKWAQARKEYQKAKRARPDRAAEVDARLPMLDREEKYFGHLAEYEQALQKSEYAEARAKLELAKQQRATQEVEDKIRQVRYLEFLALGTRAMEDEDYPGAYAYFCLAKGFLPAPGIDPADIDTLIQKAQDLKEKSTSG